MASKLMETPPSRCMVTRERKGKVRDVCRKAVSHSDKHWDPDTNERWTEGERGEAKEDRA